jgi:hypothetical protein
MPVLFVDPRGEVMEFDEPYKLAIDLNEGSPAIGLLPNGFPDSREFLDEVGAALARLVPGVRLRRFEKETLSAPASDGVLTAMAEECVAVVAAYGH